MEIYITFYKYCLYLGLMWKLFEALLCAKTHRGKLQTGFKKNSKKKCLNIMLNALVNWEYEYHYKGNFNPTNITKMKNMALMKIN